MQKGRICTRESNDVGKRVDFAPVATEIRGGRKGRTHRQGLEQLHNKEKKSDRRATRASSDAGPELAGRAGPAAMESPQDLIAAPLERGSGGLKRNARSVRGWDRVPMKKQDQGGKSSLGQHCCPIADPLSRIKARPVSC